MPLDILPNGHASIPKHIKAKNYQKLRGQLFSGFWPKIHIVRCDESRRRNVISRLLFRLTFIPDQAQQPGRAHTSNTFSPNKAALPRSDVGMMSGIRIKCYSFLVHVSVFKETFRR